MKSLQNLLAFINVNITNNRIPKYVKQKVTKLKREMNNLKLIVEDEDFNTFNNGLKSVTSLIDTATNIWKAVYNKELTRATSK